MSNIISCGYENTGSADLTIEMRFPEWCREPPLTASGEQTLNRIVNLIAINWHTELAGSDIYLAGQRRAVKHSLPPPESCRLS